MEKIKFKVYKASSRTYEKEMEFETLQEFLDFVKNLKQNERRSHEVNSVIVSYEIKEGSFYMTIYDDHIE
jgi:uncharacterized protein with GYD domain